MKTFTSSPQRSRVFGLLAALAIVVPSFGARVEAQTQEVTLPTNLLPPPEGMYISPALFHVLYANGVRIKDVSHLRFTDSLPPPALGAPAQIHTFGSTVRMMVSTDGGLSFFPATAPAQVTARLLAVAVPVGSPPRWNTEMLQLSISGGTLPAGVMVRESPTLASTGRTTVRALSNGAGYAIASFFDIFTELSLNGGQTWSPAQAAAHVELRGDPTKTTPIKTPTRLLPPPNDLYISPSQFHVLFAQGIVIRDVKHRFFTQSLPAPPVGGPPQAHTFDSQVDMEVSLNGGATFQRMRAPAAVTVQVSPRANWDGTDVYDTEMLALNLQGGDLPPGVMLRESPTKQSLGGTAIAQAPIGDPDFDLLRIGSFFDIFTEISLDGGQNWSPADSAAHVVLDCNAPEVTESSPNLPPPGDEYVSPSDFHAAFAAGIIIKDIKHDRFTQSQPPPPPGGAQIHSFQSHVQFRISTDNGVTFQPGRAPAQCVAQVRSSVDDGATRFFDTEMLALNITGGTLPAGVMLRESPSKASLGRTSIRMVTDPGGAIWDYISSFFDIFVELTVDGGATWQPSTNGPAEVVLQKPPTPHFFTSNALPPQKGVYVSPADFHAAYANGIIIQNVSHKRFTQSLPPPPPGSTQVHNFGSTVEMDVSSDGGLTFQRVSAPASVTARVTGFGNNPDNLCFYDTEMLSLNISGGSLPTGVMVRESPSKASLGRTTIEPVGGGYMIDSFFDIFTEISLDGGQNWSPAAEAAHVELTVDPTLITPIKAPTNLLPPPNDLYISPALFHVLFAQGIVIRDVKHRFFSGSLPPPPLGQSQVHTFDSQVDMEVSQDGGQTFQPVRAPAAVTVRLAHTRDEGGTQIFDTEMLQLDIHGGDLPLGVMLRESPTRRSLGGTAMAQAAIGDPDFDLLRIGSFFDIFTELSIDGGQNWSPAASAPAHVELICNAPEVVEPTPNLPPIGDQYVSPEDFHVAFASGIIIKDISHDQFTQSQPPPPPGASQIHSFQSRVQFRISQDGGVTFNPGSAPAFAVVQVTSSTDAGSTRFFDTEMLSLEIQGGSLPPGVMLRESPSKASLGRTSIRMVTDSSGVIWDYISSFFDIFVEMSVNGGATWDPSVSGPAEVVLAKSAKPHFFTTNVLPPGNGVYVSPADFHAAYANGIIIKNVSHNRFTQGLPPPPPGGTQVHNFGSTVHMDVSNDGGATFQHVSAPASVSARVSHVSDAATTSFFDTEMLALNISGGGLPTGVMVRESPSKASLGRTSIEPVGGGYMIDSFFDIFTEISLDGGQNWSPSAEPGHVELTVDPTLIPPVQAPTTLLPPPNDLYVSPALFHVLFAQGIIIRDVKHRFFTGSLPAPPSGQNQVHAFDSQVDMEVSIDGGQTFRPSRAPAAVRVRVLHTRDEGTTQIFDTEMLQLDIQGGDLLPGVMLRESPTKQSQGGTAITPNTDNTNRIGSFFDIFTELSVDGGQNWSPASAPAHVELQCNAPELVETSPNLPPLLDEYVSPADFHAAFAQGIIIKDVKHDRFTQSTPPPPPGGTQVHSFDSRVRFMISQNNGQTFSPGLAFADVSVRVTSSQDQETTRYFDTEMLSLNIHGGSLPAGVMLRESPSKASLGRTSVRTVPTGYRTSSFFDIFTELSLDGGQNWSPSLTGPVEVDLHDPDADNDGLEDAWELAFFGNLTKGANEDSDGDGQNNLGELIAGTDPTNPNSVLRHTTAKSGNNLQITFRSVLGRKYRIECKTNLVAPDWVTVQSNIQGTDAPITITLPNVFDVPRRFYRVAVELSP